MRCEPRGRERARDDHHQRTGHACQAFEPEQPRECDEATRNTRRLPCCIAAHHLGSQREEIGAAGLQVHQVRPLLHRDHQREAEAVAAQYRARDQVRHRAQAQTSRQDEGDAGADHQERSERDALGEIAAPERERRGGQHGGGRGGRGDDGKAAAADEAVARQSGEQADHARLGRQVGNPRVSQRFGQQQTRDRQPGEQIRAGTPCCHFADILTCGNGRSALPDARAGARAARRAQPDPRRDRPVTAAQLRHRGQPARGGESRPGARLRAGRGRCLRGRRSMRERHPDGRGGA